jgi:hypothetical protein
MAVVFGELCLETESAVTRHLVECTTQEEGIAVV